MAVFSSPFDTLLGLQQALDAFRTSGWLDEAGPSGGGAYPPINVFRKGDDFAIIAEVPGVKKSDLDVQVKGRTIRISGTKSVAYPERGACTGANGWAAGSTAPSPCRRRSTRRRSGPNAATASSRCCCDAPRGTSRVDPGELIVQTRRSEDMTEGAMADQQELAVREKREVAAKEERTVPGRFDVPHTDVYETEDALTVVMEMPGVGREDVGIELKDDVLRVEGRIDFAKYGGMEPVDMEYNVGHYAGRSRCPARWTASASARSSKTAC